MNVVSKDRISPQGPGASPLSFVRVAPRGDRVAFVIADGRGLVSGRTAHRVFSRRRPSRQLR